jgi:hypothetical protein
VIPTHHPGLDLSAQEVVRQLALQRLEEARSALVSGDEDESDTDPQRLHGFEGALGRLQRLLQTYGESALETPQLTAALRRLNHISDATGTAREAHAQLGWVRMHLASPAAAVGRGTDPELGAGPGFALELSHRIAMGDALDLAGKELERILQARRSYGYACTREQAVPEFLALQNDLHEMWGQPHTRTAEHQPGRESFARATGRQISEAAQRLEHALRDGEELLREEPQAEQARACAAQLRSLLEPLGRRLGTARDALDRLRGLQELLAELKHLQGLRALVGVTLDRAAFERARARIAAVEGGERGEERQARNALLEDGCIAAAAAIQERRRTVCTALSREWIADAGVTFFGTLGGLSENLLGAEPAATQRSAETERGPRRETSEQALEEAFTRLLHGPEAVDGEQRRRGKSALRALRELDATAGRTPAPAETKVHAEGERAAVAADASAPAAAQIAGANRRPAAAAPAPLLSRVVSSSGLLPNQLLAFASSLTIALVTGAVLGGLAVGSAAGPALEKPAGEASALAPPGQGRASAERNSTPEPWFRAVAGQRMPAVASAPEAPGE